MLPNVGCYLVKSVLVRRDGYRYDPTCLESQSTEEFIRTFQTRRSSPASSSAGTAEPSPVDYNSQTLLGLGCTSTVQFNYTDPFIIPNKCMHIPTRKLLRSTVQ